MGSGELHQITSVDAVGLYRQTESLKSLGVGPVGLQLVTLC